MDLVPADVLWLHMLPHMSAAQAGQLARTSRRMWSSRPSREALVANEAAALAREMPAFVEWMGGRDAIVQLSHTPDLGFFGLVHALREAHCVMGCNRCSRPGYKREMRATTDGSLVRGVASPRKTMEMLVRLVSFTCEHMRPMRMWFAVLMFDYMRAALPHAPLLRVSDVFCKTLLAKLCELLGSAEKRPRDIDRRVGASCRRLAVYLVRDTAARPGGPPPHAMAAAIEAANKCASAAASASERQPPL